MPVVEKIGGGEVYLRGIDRRVTAGERVDVSEEFATYLTEERGDFKEVQATDVEFTEVDEGDGSGSQGDEPPDDTVPVEDAIDQGVCPWCDDYEGDGVAQHASSAHPDRWDAYKED